jgi:hypothetical protein
MTIWEKLLPRLLARFPDRSLRVHEGTQPAATFPAAHPEVGDLSIDDDGGGGVELTISIGRLTHGHFFPRNYQGPSVKPSEKDEEEVVERVMEFLDEVFADQIEFWTADRAGGWHPRGKEPLVQRPNMRRFVWSGPVTPSPR